MLVILWLLLSIVVAVLANDRGHKGLVWFVLAIVISPLLAGLLLVIRGSNTAQMEARELESGEKKKCSHCAELIKREATKCRYCGEPV